ncbi:hypothetical protein U91I_03523 [alpha proteobacterium U9-1i]|nr:hypothetical protein U91I_03523 [alpha proteobacterium U9-1i]
MRADVFMAFADETIVFLDLQADRYCALSRAMSLRLADELRRRAPLSGEVVQSLRAARVLADGAGRPLALAKAPTPSREVYASRPQVFSIARAALCRGRASGLLCGSHISSIVSERRARRKNHERSEEAIVRMAAAFSASRPLGTARNACLRETLALLLFLGPRGAAVDWVFAVKGAPFAAHCWAQLGDQVLNDSADHARGYTPIMVV